VYCPKCDEPLQTAERFGVVVDYCTACRGVFLYDEDLDRIIDRAVWSERIDSAPKRKRKHSIPYDDDDDYQRRHKKRSPLRKALKEFKDIID
jgi:Zn-finger nucleic acid-binding protein